MIFFPVESLILSCFGLAVFFYYVYFSWSNEYHEVNSIERRNFIIRQIWVNKWLGRLFLIAAIAFGITASLIPVLE